MEKKKAHYSLDRIKELVRADKWMLTLTAEKNSWEQFDLGVDGVKAIVLDLNPRVFYKSMTAINDNSLWQDVYHPMVGERKGYVKLQIVDGSTVVIQFKEK